MSETPKITATTRPDVAMIDPRQAFMLDQAAGGNKQNVQAAARQLLAENALLMKVLGAVLEKVGPTELDRSLITGQDGEVLYTVERYDSTDGLTIRWVGKRVHG